MLNQPVENFPIPDSEKENLARARDLVIAHEAEALRFKQKANVARDEADQSAKRKVKLEDDIRSLEEQVEKGNEALDDIRRQHEGEARVLAVVRKDLSDAQLLLVELNGELNVVNSELTRLKGVISETNKLLKKERDDIEIEKRAIAFKKSKIEELQTIL